MTLLLGPRDVAACHRPAGLWLLYAPAVFIGISSLALLAPSRRAATIWDLFNSFRSSGFFLFCLDQKHPTTTARKFFGCALVTSRRELAGRSRASKLSRPTAPRRCAPRVAARRAAHALASSSSPPLSPPLYTSTVLSLCIFGTRNSCSSPGGSLRVIKPSNSVLRALLLQDLSS